MPVGDGDETSSLKMMTVILESLWAIDILAELLAAPRNVLARWANMSFDLFWSMKVHRKSCGGKRNPSEEGRNYQNFDLIDCSQMYLICERNKMIVKITFRL